MSTPVPPPVRASVTAAGVGDLVLDRPSALNALDLTMVELLTRALEGWRDDPAVRSVVVRSSSPKAFCAGGDIRAVRAAALAGDDAAVRGYFAAEYALNALIAAYPKPYTAVIDGYAMGGGLGISVHGSARVVSDRATLSMPETSIGFFPDIGASFFLPRLPGAVGRYLGLTGARISGAAAVECGLATHYVAATELPVLVEELLAGAVPEPRPAGHSELTGLYEAIDRCFAPGSLDEVAARLLAEDSAWARETLRTLREVSPMSLAVTDELLRTGAELSLTECLAHELELACEVSRSHDFAEGVRAALVDRDRSPRWERRGDGGRHPFMPDGVGVEGS
ncbi:enoyl-CoA hydratase/isomerase family protein [Streptomyces sp. NPDC052225]|uniref:enoyl-CoA hydratase/isomerase family protein n=1 Tax=Streptomyces sp. NPDC052225 TaxID=3154949 RepID=UPI00341DE1AC